MSSRIIYAIKDWGELYETAETRKLRNLRWVPVPNKQDGRGYSYLMAENDGAAMLGAWLMILQVASKMPRRGVLADERGPLSARDIAVKARTSAEIIARALELLASPEIDWMTKASWSPNPGNLLPPPATPADSDHFSGESPEIDPGIRREGKGTEGNRISRRGASHRRAGEPEPPVSQSLSREGARSAETVTAASPSRERAIAPQTVTTAHAKAVRLASQQTRYPCDPALARRVAEVAIETFPLIEPEQLAYLIPKAQRPHQREAALYLVTVPEEIQKHMVDDEGEVDEARNPNEN